MPNLTDFNFSDIEKSDILTNLLSMGLVEINQKNKFGFTALFVAAQNNKVEIVELLLQNSKVTGRETDKKGFMALDHAYALGHTEIVEKIKAKRPNINWEASPDAAAQIYQTMNFVHVQVGPESFAVMSTLFTQQMYLLIMGKVQDPLGSNGPGVFQHNVLVNLNGDLVRMRPDFPTRLLKNKEVLEIIATLNKLSDAKDSPLHHLIPDHQPGDHYDLVSQHQIDILMENASTPDGYTVSVMLNPD